MADVSADYSGIGLTTYSPSNTTVKEKSDKLGQADFLKLMTTQLTNQDPLEPMENGDFLGQMAQFSTVTGIESLTKEFNTLSLSLNQSQALQAATLVGKNVLAPATKMTLTDAGQSVNGAVDLSASTQGVTLNVTDANGQLIRSLNLGSLSSGLQEFSWDGLNDSGKAVPAGAYTFQITGQNDGKTEVLETLLNGQVKNVAYDSASSGLKLNVQGLGNIGFSDVYRIG
ncbi:flagellar hook assembly protein FlgD [Chromatium okenii]|uniref:flagellar hook assembly protein FlgD n=1 Tax=Chromatium okenii TaxID=61644 RepID=UPI0026F093C2|nr:flagellar hook assembly protein FlgD [Chromatium okenii]MBV5308606.1 flagellar hook assembly protein FlgD [Chromatium okenii]